MNRFVLWICIAILAVSPALAQVAPTPMPRIERPDDPAMQDGAAAAGEFMSDQDLSANSAALRALSEALNARAQQQAPAGPPQPVTLSAKISEDGAVIPSGLIWRVFDSRADENGELALLAKSTNAVAGFELRPGDYLVHVAYGRSQATDTVHVEPQPTSKTLVLDSGGLRLNAAITGDVPIDATELRFEVYATGSNPSDRVLVADNIVPGELLHLNAGVYHVISHFGRTNAIVRADLRVDPGQMTDAVLYHTARRVNFRLASEAGGEAIADVDWLVKSAEGDTVFSAFGAFPSVILGQGDYNVIARRGDKVYNRDFSIEFGPPTEIEVLTSVYESSGTSG